MQENSLKTKVTAWPSVKTFQHKKPKRVDSIPPSFRFYSYAKYFRLSENPFLLFFTPFSYFPVLSSTRLNHEFLCWTIMCLLRNIMYRGFYLSECMYQQSTPMTLLYLFTLVFAPKIVKGKIGGFSLENKSRLQM